MGSAEGDAPSLHRSSPPAVTYAIEEGVIVVRSGPRFTTDSILTALQVILADERSAGLRNWIFDYSASQESASQQELRRRIEGFRRLFGPGRPRCAMVVSSALHHGIGRMAVAMAPDEIQLAVFGTEADARRWLAALEP